ncbi:hypothetical protein AB0D83_38330 [Streptomyces decoyicus]|uniref:hypothetical protein n=1 Tax=Streptomyces decoyicus TaxID=249567 RepID=UPI0033CF8488
MTSHEEQRQSGRRRRKAVGVRAVLIARKVGKVAVPLGSIISTVIRLYDFATRHLL